MKRYGNSKAFWTAEDKQRRNLEIEILKADNCTEEEAIRHLEKGTTIYESIDEYIDSLKETVSRDEEAFKEEYGSEGEIKESFKKKGRYLDSPLVRFEGKDYIIDYAL